MIVQDEERYRSELKSDLIENPRLPLWLPAASVPRLAAPKRKQGLIAALVMGPRKQS